MSEMYPENLDQAKLTYVDAWIKEVGTYKIEDVYGIREKLGIFAG